MAYIDDLTTPATGDAAMRRLKDRLVAAGWTVAASGDGRSAYAAAGDAITADSGAGSLDASGAWMRLRMGGGATRELLFVRGASSTTWTVRYSAAGFVVGSPPPSATTAPTAADQQNLISAAQLLPTDGSYRWLVCAEDAAPWHFWAGAIPTGGGAARTLVGLWPMRSGSYPVSDAEPYVSWASYDGTSVATAVRLSDRTVGTKGFVGGVWRACSPLLLCVTDAGVYWYSAVSQLGAASGEELPAEILCGAWASGPTYHGPRGYVRDARWCMTNTTTSPHGTHLEQGSRYWVRVGDLWLPWGSTPPAL